MATEEPNDNIRKLSPQSITREQRDWLEKHAKQTGNAITVIVRSLIQDAINREKTQD